MAEIYYQGHGSMRLTAKDGTVIYFDPASGDGYDRPADIVLVTHQHPDHNRIDLPPIKENCTIIQNQDALFDGTYRRFELGGIVIQAVEAYNLVHSRRKCVGYLVTVDHKKIYFAGDTSRTKQMDTFAKENIDYAFLPTDGFANMGPRGAAKCSHIIKAKHTIPIHMTTNSLYSEKKAARFNGYNKMLIRPGETVTL